MAKSLAQLPTDRLLTATTTPVLRAIALVHAGIARMWRGELAEADQALKVAVGLAHDSRLVLAEADALASRSLVLALRGRLRAAERTAGTAIALVEPAGNGWHAAGAHLARALVHDQRAAPDAAAAELDAVPTGSAIGRAATLLGAQLALARADVAAARALLAAALDQAAGPEAGPLLQWWLAEAGAAQYLAEHRPEAAATALDLRLAHGDTVLAAAIRVSTARVLLARGAAAPARAVLAPVHEHDVGAVVHTEAWLLDALAADLLGLEGAVCVAVSEALAAAQPEGVRRPFLSGGASDLLGRHRDLTRGWSIVDGLAGTGNGRRPPPGTEMITRREVVVLRYLPTLLTTREIAAEIYVSPNTVKTQLKSIYRKLAVGTRREAVDRARRLGLL